MIFFALGILMMVNGGCLSPFVMQAAGGAAGGAGPSSSNYLGRGRGESYFIARYDDVIKAALRAGELLALEIKEKKVEAQKTSLQYEDGKANKIKLLIERRTDTMTSILFDVGWFGSVAFGRLMARQIISELDQAGAFLEDWTAEGLSY
jgi:hypothetical protein